MTSPEPRARCHVALELSQAKWLIGALLPGRAKAILHAVRGGDAGGLVDVLRKLEQRASAEAGVLVSVSVCFESGYDGFWLARFLADRGIDTHVLDAASFLVSRRGRRAKTDRIDVEAMAFTLKAYLAGDHSVCRTVEVPTPAAEDAKRLSRERTQLTCERTRHVNRIRGLLTLHGISDVKGLWGGAWREALEASQTGDGRPLGPFLRAEIAREFERLHLVLAHMRQLDAERRAATAAATLFRDAPKVERLVKLAGVGEIGATVLVTEVFHRRFQNRKHLASYLGLTPSPYASGESCREQGISKAGNKPARTLLVELAWCWLRYQPGSGLAEWYRRTSGPYSTRSRKVGIVALARKLAIALWRFVEQGVIPAGAVMSPQR
jgi:transposase